MKKVLKWVGIGFVTLLAAMLLFVTMGLREATNLTLHTVSLTNVPDGRYTGAYENNRFSNTVTVTVKDHAIAAIQPEKAALGQDTLAQELTERVIAAQSPAVDGVSGATASSKSMLKAIENALQSAPGAEAVGQ